MPSSLVGESTVAPSSSTGTGGSNNRRRQRVRNRREVGEGVGERDGSKYKVRNTGEGESNGGGEGSGSGGVGGGTSRKGYVGQPTMVSDGGVEGKRGEDNRRNRNNNTTRGAGRGNHKINGNNNDNRRKNNNGNGSNVSRRKLIAMNGSAINSNSRSNNVTSSTASTRTGTRMKPLNTHSAPLKRNGEKGASSHSVSEDTRIKLTRLLHSLRENEEDNHDDPVVNSGDDVGNSGDKDTGRLDKGVSGAVELPPNLTNTERKFVHELCARLGLKSRSYGKGSERRVYVSRQKRRKVHFAGMCAEGNDTDDGEENFDSRLPSLHVGVKGVEALKNHMRRYKPSKKEMASKNRESNHVATTTTDSPYSLEGSSNALSSVGEENNDDHYDDNNNGEDNNKDNNNNDERINGTTRGSSGNESGCNDKRTHTTAMSPAPVPTPIKHRHRRSTPSERQKWCDDNAKRERHPRYTERLRSRKSLPAYQKRREIIETIQANPVTVISGDTGCGKSTQIPQFLLEDEEYGPSANIIVTQPRRVAAITLAERVMSERCENDRGGSDGDNERGCKGGGTVGYAVRLESSYTRGRKRLLFVTPGVLLKRLVSERDLDKVTHVVIDEVHERDRNVEFLLVALRDIMMRRWSRSRKEKDCYPLRLVLMSATVPTDGLMGYWRKVVDLAHNGVGNGDAAELHIPGRTFPVQEFFLEHILAMTGYADYVGYSSGSSNREHSINNVTGNDTEVLAELEADLAKLLVSSNSGGASRSKKKGDAGKTNSGMLEVSLTCVICGSMGFATAEELGTHIVSCDGSGLKEGEGDGAGQNKGYTAVELEAMLIETDTYETSIMKNKRDKKDKLGKSIDNQKDDTERVQEHNECSFSTNNDDVNGFDGSDDDGPGKWNGISPYIAAPLSSASGPSSTLTFTDDELLKRYQSMHDDERVDVDLTVEILRHVHASSYGDGAILVFLPGWGEISELSLLLANVEPFRDQTRFKVLPLHSGVPSRDQRKAFERVPRGTRKIVLATNIAETSVTIDDVAFVIDTGRAREKSYDPHLGTSTLQPVWVSAASAKQRMGRAGRTRAGVCFRLYSKRRMESFRPFVESEMLRTPLEEMCLRCREMGLAPGMENDPDGIPAFLGSALTPPHPKAITNAIELLVDIGAMKSISNELTDLGRCLSTLSLEPCVGKMLIWSYILGCADSTSSMAVSMSYKSPFVLPPLSMRSRADRTRVEMSKGSESDQVTILNLLSIRDGFLGGNGENGGKLVRGRKGGRSGWREYCDSTFVNHATIETIADLRGSAARELSSLGFPNPSSRGWQSRNGSHHAFLQAALVAGLYPNIAARAPGETNFRTVTDRKAKVHVSSINSCKGQRLGKKCERIVEFIAYGEIIRGVSSFTMSQTSRLVSPVPILLLCGSELSIRPLSIQTSSSSLSSTSTISNICHNGGTSRPISVLSVDDWAIFTCDSETAKALVLLRKRLEDAFNRMVSRPSSNLSNLDGPQEDAVRTLTTVLISSYEAIPRR